MLLALLLLVVFVLGIGITKIPILAAVITAFVGAGLWRASIHRTPFRRCRTCGGAGRQSGALFTWAHRQCPSCAGSGRHRRYFVTGIYGSNQTRAEQRALLAQSRANRPR
jgi:hypothetical protein